MALIAAGLISCAVPLATSAMLLGELTVNSPLGQPLRASIPLKASPEEELDSRCFSLVRPEGPSDYASYLTQARLELLEKNGQFQINIHSVQAVNEPYVRLRVQENCGQGHLSRDYTLLLDPVEYAQTRTQVIKPAVVAGTQNPATQDQHVWDVRKGETLHSIAASLYPRNSRMQRSFLRSIRNANPELRDTPADEALTESSTFRVPALRTLSVEVALSPVVPKSEPERTRRAAKRTDSTPVEQVQSSQPSGPEGGFHLKLSTSDLDLSMVGKMTEAQLQQLREKQRLLDADDQVANTLSMKNRIMQLEDQIDSLQKALEKTNNRMLLSEKLAAPPAQKIAPPSPEAGVSWLDNTSFRGLAGGGLILALLLSGWWRWRRRRAEAELDSELAHEFAMSEIPQFEPDARPDAEQIREGGGKPEVAGHEDDFLSNVTSIFDREGESVTFTEAESVLDEADLYMAYGWSNRAIELLQDYMGKHPDDVSLWKKLFEVYGSLGMKQEFEQLALRCQSTMDDSSLWVLVQKMGRQIDAENSLYISSPEELDATLQEEVADVQSEQNAAPSPVDEAQDQVLLAQDDVPTLDMPLDFVLDRKDEPEKPPADKEQDHLELDPLFPEMFENTRPFPDDGNGDKSTR
ncbi:MAG: hypothetical protein K8H84_01205 [Sulfuricella denitrificans]|nr:hypothetical protein [Sulfuricella denitrificans]